MSRVQRWISGLSVCALAAALSVTAVAQEGGEGQSPWGAAPPVATVTPEVGNQVAALRAPATKDDVLPELAAAFVSKLRPQGANAALARKTMSDGAWSLFLVPGEDSACSVLTSEAGGSHLNCASVSDLVEGSSAPSTVLTGCTVPSGATTPTCKSAILFGVARDGVDTVRVRLGSGEQVSAPVNKNGYVVEIDARSAVRGIGFTGENGFELQTTPAGVAMAAGR